MDDRIKQYIKQISEMLATSSDPDLINSELSGVTMEVDASELDIDTRVTIASYVLKLLGREQRIELCKTLIMEQVVKQRERLRFWSTLTAQSGMIDTGYIAQHLVSLCTMIPGQGMRGKGKDLVDGSEVKSANFLDSRDRKGAKEPRWNFSVTKEDALAEFLHYKLIYLVSLDNSAEHRLRIRIWEVDIRKHTALRKRYKEWMENPQRKSNNFQLFPPKSESDSIYAHHGSNKEGQLPPTEIALENVAGARKIFHAEVIDGHVVVSVFAD